MYPKFISCNPSIKSSLYSSNKAFDNSKNCHPGNSLLNGNSTLATVNPNLSCVSTSSISIFKSVIKFKLAP